MNTTLSSNNIFSNSGGGLNPADQALIAQIPNKQDISEKGQANGYAGLDGDGKVPLTNLPNSLKEIKIVADITARDNIIAGERFEGLSVLVEDASADPTVSSGYAIYVLKAGLANTDWFKTGEGESVDLVLSATNTTYNNTASGATATNLQDATDELFDKKQNKIYDYTVEAQANLTTIVGATNGQFAFVKTEASVYQFNGSSSLWEKVSTEDVTAFIQGQFIAQEYINEQPPIKDIFATVENWLEVATLAELEAAVLNDKFCVKLTATITLTANLEIGKNGYIDCNGFDIKTAQDGTAPVVMFTLANGVDLYIRSSSGESKIHHLKTTNTSNECVVDARDGGLYVDNTITISAVEFGVRFEKGYLGCKLEYSEAGTADNSMRFIHITGATGDMIIDEVFFPTQATSTPTSTRRTNAILFDSVRWVDGATLVIRNCADGDRLRQFFIGQSATPTNMRIVFVNNNFDDLNGGIFTYFAEPLNHFELLAFINNKHGTEGEVVSDKGMFYLSAPAGANLPVGDKAKLVFFNNKTQSQLRATYSSLMEDGSAVFALDTAIFADPTTRYTNETPTQSGFALEKQEKKVQGVIFQTDYKIQQELNLKAPLESPEFTGEPTTPTAPAGTNTTQIASTAYVQTEISGMVKTEQTSSTDNGFVVFNGTSGKLIKETTKENFKTSLSLVKSDVGLGNVDNTSDLNKPISTATQTALDTKGNSADFRQESTLFVEQTYGLDTNGGTTPNKPFKTVGKAWTEINSSGQIKVLGSATYDETHTFEGTKTSIKTVLDQGAKINGEINLVQGNNSMYFSGGMFGGTLNDESAGTTYFENTNVGGATFKFTNGGYKVIRGSSSAPLKIELSGVAGILYLENISGGSVSIDIGIGWVVFLDGAQLNIGTRFGTVVDGLLVLGVIENQAGFDALALDNNVAGYYVLNFANPVIKDNGGQVIKTFVQGDVIYKIGPDHQFVHSIQSAPSSLNLVIGFNQATTLIKRGANWVRFDEIPSGTNSIVVASEEERKALKYGTGLNEVRNFTVVYQRDVVGSIPFVFNGGDSQDVTANANWVKVNTTPLPAIKPTARIFVVSGQSNTSGYAALDATYFDDIPASSGNLEVMPSRCLLSNSTEDANLFFDLIVTADGTNTVTIANTAFRYELKKGQRVYGTNVPANTYVDAVDLNNDFRQLRFTNNIPATVTLMKVSKIEGAPINLQAFNATGRRTLPAYRIGNQNGSGVMYFFAKSVAEQHFQENSNDVLCIVNAINGSTGFANNGAWVAGTGYLALETVRLYNLAKEYYESMGFNVTLVGGAFCLGEEDSRQGTTQANMQNFCINLINYYKNNCLSTVGFPAKAPFWLFNGLHSYWLNSTLGYSRAEVIPLNQKVAVDNAFRNMPQLVEGATYVAFPTQNKDYTQADCIHVTVPSAKKQGRRLTNAIPKAQQNTTDSPSNPPENFTVNGVQETGALASWDALFQQKYDLEWKFAGQDWEVATKVYDLEQASYSIPADSGTTVDVRVRAKKANGTGISQFTEVLGTTLNSTIQNEMTVRFYGGINSDANFVLTSSLGNLNPALETGADHIERWLNEIPNARHAENLIMGTAGPHIDTTTTLTLTANSNIATVGNATGIVVNKTFVDIVTVIGTGEKHSDYSILPRNTIITAINGTQITMSNPAPAVVNPGGYNIRLRYDRTLTQTGTNLTQTGGNRQGNPVRSKILNNKNEWLHCLNIQSENNGLIVDDLLDGNFSYSGTVLFRHTAYNTLAAVEGSGLTPIANTGAYGGNVALDTGSRNYVSRIIKTNLAQLSTSWRRSNLRVTVNHNTIDGGAIDTTDILADRWYLFTFTFNRTTGLIKLYRNGNLVAQHTNTAVLTAFIGFIGCIHLSNGFRAGSPGSNFLTVAYHKRELANTEVVSFRTFLTNKFNITLG